MQPVDTHTPELVMALACLSGLLALLACVVWQGPCDRAVDWLVDLAARAYRSVR